MENYGFMIPNNAFEPGEQDNASLRATTDKLEERSVGDYVDASLSKLIPSSGLDLSINNSSSIKEIIEETRYKKIKTLKAKIEAILFLSEKPRSADSIAEQAEADLNLVKQCLNQLVQEYENRDGGLVIDCSQGYCMQISDNFESLTENILPIELRTAVLRTLSTIALKEPLYQKDLVDLRGGGIYDHVKELISIGLVKRTKEGHSHVLHTTKFFAENFKLSQNGLELQKILKSSVGTDIEFVRPKGLIEEPLTNE
jgi:segregation and condensation protein B